MSVEPQLPEKQGEFTNQQREFVRLYTDPTLGTYMNARQAAKRAGMHPKSGPRLLGYDHVKAEIERIMHERVEEGREIADMLWDQRHGSARALAESLAAGLGMRIIDPESEFGEGMADVLQAITDEDGNVKLDEKGQPVVLDQTKRLREINRHNKNALKALREARQAAELLLAYNLGQPEQVHRHKTDDTPDQRTLEGMDDEELVNVQDLLREELEKRTEKQPDALPGGEQDDGPIEDADYEIVD